MRRSREEAAETRRNIVKTAGVRFRQNGICETGLADLMGSAGLTHGGFYRHFDSKDRLAPSLALQLLCWDRSESMGNHDSDVVDASSVD